MPVVKVPIVHKFGIISHSQRLALQQRLLEQNYAQEEKPSPSQSRANPLVVCEKLVQKYSDAKLQEREEFRTEANRILTHSKRRAGISTQGEGEHVDLPMAWSELAILAQCKGKLQDDCFEVLCKSLNHAPLHEENIPTLFFLAESTLYWMRTDALNSSHLRTAEIRLLKLGFLVFARLYYHHLVNNLAELGKFKSRLLTYLDGIKDHEELYKSYPGVWLCLRFVIRVGDMICSRKRQTSPVQGNDPLSQPNGINTVLIRPIVYQSLHVWRCKDKGVGLKKAILDVIICAKDLTQENWVDSLIAVSILGDAAKANFLACQSLQDIARGATVPITDIATPRTVEYITSTVSPKKRVTGNADEDFSASNKTRADTFQNIMTGMIEDFDSALGKTPHTQSKRRETTTETNQRGKADQSSTKSNIQSSNLPGTSHFTSTERNSAGLSNPNTPRSEAGESISMGISAWGWEVAYHYSQITAEICLYGATAPIQKLAMLGKWLGADVTTFRAGVPNFCIDSCGLVDLLEYRNPKLLSSIVSPDRETPQTSNVDWSWRIRYGALSGLLHLTHALKEDKLKEGMRSAAWSLIVSLQDSAASEDRVLEALRVGQVEYPDFHKSVSSGTSMNIWSRISHSLTEHFLLPTLPISQSPSLFGQHPVPPQTRQSTQRSPRMKLSPPPLPTRSHQSTPRKDSLGRTTLKDHLTIPTLVDRISADFHKRNALNLQRMVEDQWRKQLMREHEEEEKDRIRELQEKQKEDEKRIIELAQKRREKLKGKPTENLGPYQTSQFDK